MPVKSFELKDKFGSTIDHGDMVLLPGWEKNLHVGFVAEIISQDKFFVLSKNFSNSEGKWRRYRFRRGEDFICLRDFAKNIMATYMQDTVGADIDVTARINYPNLKNIAFLGEFDVDSKKINLSFFKDLATIVDNSSDDAKSSDPADSLPKFTQNDVETALAELVDEHDDDPEDFSLSILELRERLRKKGFRTKYAELLADLRTFVQIPSFGYILTKPYRNNKIFIELK